MARIPRIDHDVFKDCDEDILAILNEEIQKEIDREMIAVIRGEAPPLASPSPSPLPSPGILGIVREGQGRYRVRGFGTEDQRFWQHANDIVEVTGDDWPWTYIRLLDRVTHDQLLEGFAQHYMGDDTN